MLLRFQCVVPHVLGNGTPPPKDKEFSAEEIKNRLEEIGNNRQVYLDKSFRLNDWKYGVKKIISALIKDDDEIETAAATIVTEYTNFTVRDPWLKLDANCCVVNHYVYGETSSELYQLIEANDWNFKTENNTLDLANLIFKTSIGEYPCSIIDLDAPIGFEHPGLFKAFREKKDPFKLFSPRELLTMALHLNPKFHEEIIHSDYVTRSQNKAITNSWLTRDDLETLKAEFEFVKGAKNDFTWKC